MLDFDNYTDLSGWNGVFSDLGIWADKVSASTASWYRGEMWEEIERIEQDDVFKGDAKFDDGNPVDIGDPMEPKGKKSWQGNG